MSEEQALEIYQDTQLSVSRPPQTVLEEAGKAAEALKDVISKKKKPVIFGGEQYLEFEDWQTIARFYGVTARVKSTAHVQYGDVHGFEASAETILVGSGQVISGADAMCLNDEKNWKGKPMFQLRSMAQTRACAKALRNVLAWVVVLAGYKPTPAEEMAEMGVQKDRKLSQKPKQVEKEEPEKKYKQNPESTITESQGNRFNIKCKKSKIPKDLVMKNLDFLGYSRLSEIKVRDYEQLCEWADSWKPLPEQAPSPDEPADFPEIEL
jgi:hypothetical protein